MKRIFGVVLVLLVIAVGFTVLRFLPRPPIANNPANSSAQPLPDARTDKGEDAGSATAQGVKSAIPQATFQPQMSSSNMLHIAEQKADQLRQALEQKNVPVDFYGRVIDQASNSVSGVKVNVYIRRWALTENAMSQPTRMELLTGADGSFHIHGIMGDAIGIESMHKDGYEQSSKTPSSFGPTGGSIEAPILYKIWKNGEKAALVSYTEFWGVNPDGRVYTIDLMLGTKTESATVDGDLRISVNRPGTVNRKDKYDWSFNIQAVEGGILESADEFMYQAPDSGYAPEYNYRVYSMDTNWTPSVKRAFYVKTRGHFARANIEVISRYQNAGVFSISCAVNPDGSRNLEPK